MNIYFFVLNTTKKSATFHLLWEHPKNRLSTKQKENCRCACMRVQEGEAPRPKKKMYQISGYSCKKKYKIDYISKTKNRTKKFIQAKNERQINYNIFCKFSHFWRKLNFWGAIRARLDASGAQTQYDVIWNFTPNIFFSILRIFNVEMVTSGGRVGWYAYS